MSNRRALLIGPFPPPIGGDTVLSLNLSRSTCWKEHGIELDCVDTSPKDKVRLPGRRLSVKDLMRGARILCEVLWKMPRCGVVLMLANDRFILTEGLAVILCGSIMGRSVILKVFGASFARSMGRLSGRSKKSVRTILGRAAWILPETRSLARELVDEAGFPPDRVLFLPNFLPDSSFNVRLTRRRFSGKCVFFGQIKREKGVFDIIEALAKCTDSSCDFYGPVVERDRGAFLDAVSKHANCAYKGSVDPGTVSAVAAAYDVLLLPTYHEGEGYPAVVLEAYAAGIPVIASNWLSLPEIVDQGVRGILVPVKSPEKIREAIKRLFADGRLYESMCMNAAAFVKSFSETAVLKGILAPLVAQAFSGGHGRDRRACRIDGGEHS